MDALHHCIRNPVVGSMAPPGEDIGGGQGLGREAVLGLLESGAAHAHTLAQLPAEALGDGTVHAVGIDSPDRRVAPLVDMLVPHEDP